MINDRGEIRKKIVFAYEQFPIFDPFFFEIIEIVGDRNGRSGGRRRTEKIEEGNFRIVVDGGGYVVFNLENLTEIISDRQAEIPNTLDKSAERVREEEYTRDKTDCNRYGYIVPIVNPFHTSQPVNTK